MIKPGTIVHNPGISKARPWLVYGLDDHYITQRTEEDAWQYAEAIRRMVNKREQKRATNAGQ